MNPNHAILETGSHCVRRMAGAIRNPLLTLIAVTVVLASSGYALIRAEHRARQCMQHLRHIYLALEMYELDHGTLPHMAFYPDATWYSADSMLVVLDPYAITSQIGTCPGDHEVVRAQGLSYIWNANLNGALLQEQDRDTWLVTGLSALSEQVSGPHLGRHITLYADGRIVRSRKPPRGLTEIRP